MTIKVYVEKHNKLGEIVYIHDTISETYLAYPKGNKKLLVDGKSKEECYEKIKRIIKMLKEID